MIKDHFATDAFTDASVAYGFDASDFPEFKDLTSNFKFNFSDNLFFNEAQSKLTPKELRKLEKKRKECGGNAGTEKAGIYHGVADYCRTGGSRIHVHQHVSFLHNKKRLPGRQAFSSGLYTQVDITSN